MSVTPFPRRLRAEVAMPTAYSLPEHSWTSTAFRSARRSVRWR